MRESLPKAWDGFSHKSASLSPEPMDAFHENIGGNAAHWWLKDPLNTPPMGIIVQPYNPSPTELAIQRVI
jgi:hypothetical protein